MNTRTTQKFLNSALTRIIIGLILCFAAFILAQNLTGKFLDFFPVDKNFRNLIKGIVASFSVIIAYRSFYQKFEKRKVSELSGNAFFKNIILGISIGTLLQCLTILIIYFFGDIHIVSINSFSSLIIPFSIAFSVAIFEEILIRGIIFRIAEEKLGSYISLIISGVIFGVVHLMNPGSTIISSLCVGLAGVIFGVTYIYSRSLWLPIAIHFSWNFVQSGIFGAVTSGNEKSNSFLNTTISGPELITGGAFGPEGSIQAMLLWLMLSFIFMMVIINQNKLIKRFQKKISRLNAIVTT